MRKFLLLIFLNSFAFAQTPVDKWFFGLNTGLDFTGGGPAVISGVLNTIEGCSTISDATGNLLFYTDGITVWNKNHVVMGNGTGLLGNPSSTQAALIVPTPSNVNQYYIFTTDAQGGANGLRYSLVDMSLSAGTGSVTVKNIMLLTPVTEKLAAIKSPVSSKLWLTTHAYGNNNFYSYEINGAGIQSPVISSVGISHNAPSSSAIGQMKFNSCGYQLAVAVGSKDTVEVFNFNQNTGQITSPITIPLAGQPYGIEFSGPVPNMLYVATSLSVSTLVQYDLTAGSQSAIIASKTTLGSFGIGGSLQLGPDGKIYSSVYNTTFLGVINNPMVPGTGCNYNPNGVNVDPLTSGKKAYFGLNTCMVGTYFPCGVVGINEMNSKNDRNLIYPNPSSNEFNLKLESLSSIEVYSFTGKLVDSFNKVDDKFSFGKEYASGIYFVRINNEAKIKLVKE
jgi:hypothetical protein